MQNERARYARTSTMPSLNNSSISKTLNWRDSVIALVLIILGVLVLYIALFFHVLELSASSSWVFDWTGHLWFLAIPLIWYFAFRKRFPIGKLSKISIRQWLPAWVILLAVVIPLEVLTSQKMSLAGISLLAIIMNLLFNGVLVGISEEFVFRGQIQTGLNNSVKKTLKIGKGNIRLGTVLTALIFAGIHFQNILSIPFALFFGMIVGHFYDKTNNIWGAVVIHNIVDFLSFVIPVIL